MANEVKLILIQLLEFLQVTEEVPSELILVMLITVVLSILEESTFIL